MKEALLLPGGCENENEDEGVVIWGGLLNLRV